MAEVRRLVTRPERLRRDEVAALRQAVLPFLEDVSASSGMVQAVRRLLGQVDLLAGSSNRWRFVLISPEYFGGVVRHLRKNSVRPAVAVDLWSMCFRWLTDDGELLFQRKEFAAELGVAPRVVSRLMGELIACKALRRERDGSGFRYFVNPRAGTHLSGVARDEAQAAAPALELVGGTGRPSERRSRGRPKLLPVL